MTKKDLMIFGCPIKSRERGPLIFIRHDKFLGILWVNRRENSVGAGSFYKGFG
jgi:hypothetical protein